MNTSHSSHRRSTFSSRLRENRPQTPVNQTGHRRKSRSPDARVPEEPNARTDTSNNRKRRKQNGGVTATIAGPSQPPTARSSRASVHSNQEDIPSDHGRKTKRRPQSVSEDTDLHVIAEAAQQLRRRGRSRRRERSQSRDTAHRLSLKIATPEPSEVEGEERQYTGPFAVADYARVKEELDKAKKHMALAKKTIKQQSKVIDGLRQDLTNAEKSHSEQCKQVEKLKVQAKQSQDVISHIEANLNCQICLEIMMKPYGLSPCGHVLCLKCLQQWFREAPTGEDETYDNGTSIDLVYRRKSCPVCRASVLSPPIPLFLVKSLARAIDKSRQLPDQPPRPSPSPEADPWAGIFGDSTLSEDEDDWSGEDEGGEDEDEDYDDDEDGYHFGDAWPPLEGYGTDEDEEPYYGGYVQARWAPPTVYVSPEDYTFDDVTEEQMSMLRRGATLQMIALFSMSYTHEDGLKAYVDGNELYLGWNIELHEEDPTGEEFMDWMVSDVYERPERWEKEEGDPGFIAWRLMKEEEDEEYGTTDSEAWAADLTIDEDEF